MKELSIEEKASRYDEAIQVAKDNYYAIMQMDKDCTFAKEGIVNTFHHMFPELKESGDEKIRKAIGYAIGQSTHSDGTLIDGVSSEEALSWVEKQGVHEPIVVIPKFRVGDVIRPKGSMAEYTIESIYGECYHGKGWGLHIGYEDYYELVGQKTSDKVEPKFKVGDWVIGRATNNEPRQILEITDQYYKSTYGGQYGFSFEDEMHLWTINDVKECDVISYNDGHGNDCIGLIKSIVNKKIEFWFCLTNGEQYEVFDEIIPYTNLVSREGAIPATKEQRDLLFKKMKEAGYEWDAEKKELKTIEEKPTNDIEPKFKVGDWVVTTFGKVNQVVEIYYDCGGFTLDDGTYFSGSWKDNYHLWTIKDAKDGDVLCCESGWTCIFKALDNHTNTFSSYCFMDKSKWFCNAGCEGHSLDEAFINAYNGEIHPATKEQCDKLEKVMTDAGYTFDFESKELKKIEQKSDSFCREHCRGFQETGKCFADGDCKAKRKAEQNSAWSEDDENELNHVIKILKSVEEEQETKGYNNLIGTDNWLKSLKGRILSQQKKEWSEEDERMFARIEEAIKSYYAPFSKDAEEMLNWFNPIKDRVQPQNFPVTDEELIKARNEAYNDALYKLEYHSDTPTFNDGWGAAIWYLKKRNVQRQNNWKPSDEQMKLLREVQAALLGKDCHNRFVNFMYELKRLKEE